jgi:hypothetical protein
MQTVIVQDFIICKPRRIVIRVAFLYKAVYVMRFTHKNDVVRGFVCRAEQYTCHGSIKGVKQYLGFEDRYCTSAH